MADIKRMTSVGARGTNPVLPEGTYGWERDTGVVKLGDGVTQWNNLGLAGIAPGAIPASVVLKIEAVTASEYATLPWVDPEIMYVIDDGRVLLGSKSLASSGLDQPADSDCTFAITSDTSNVYLYLLDASGGYSRGNNFSATAPFTFGADDKLIVSGVYPVAAKS